MSWPLFLLFVPVLAITLLLACGDNSSPSVNDGVKWEVVKSPRTGLCYEVFYWNVSVGLDSKSNVGYAAGGGPIDCNEYYK